MIQAVLKNVGGRITSDFLDRYPSTVTVTLYTGDGTSKASGTATTDTVNTTISADASVGDTSVSVASASGVQVGRRYLLGAAGGSAPRETVSVRYLDSSTAVFWAPLMNDHASGARFHGTRAYFDVTSTQANGVWWDGYATFTPADGTDVQTETVDCVLRKIPEQACDETDILRVFPKGAGMLDEELDTPAAIKEARDWFLLDLGGKGMGGRARAMTVLGVDHFRRPVAIKFWLQRRSSLGADFSAELDALEKEYDAIIERIQSLIPTDNDQDGTTTGVNDGNFTVGRMQRA